MTTTNQNNSGKPRQPTHFVSVRHGEGKNATFERVGAGWLNEEKGTIYIKFAGTQLISDCTLIENKDMEAGA